VHDPSLTAFHPDPLSERGGERALVRPAARPAAHRSHSNEKVVPIAVRPETQRPAQEGNPAGQAFADLLLLGATAAGCPLALLSVARNGRWSTLSFGTDHRDALDDPELFAIIAARKEPVEINEPATNPALSHSRLAHSALGVRWLLGLPLVGADGNVQAVYAVLDVEPKELGRRERSAMLAVGRQLVGALSAFRAPVAAPPAPEPASTPASSPRLATDGHQLLRSHEVASLFDVTERTVINWAASGKLPCLRTVGGHLRFRSDDVLALLEANSLRRRVP
jgi:excisionase family DNA binding protein